MELQFYIKEDIKECWKVKALKRQINIIHAPYVLEFVEIPQQKRYKETELEKALKINMEQFLSELGRCLYWRTNWCQTFQS